MTLFMPFMPTMPITLPETDPALELELEWVVAARRGDQDAFAALVRRHQRRVAKLAGRFFRRPEDVEEAAQETFLQAWRKLHTFRSKAPFEHWITRICLNTCLQSLRKKKIVSTALDVDLPELHPADPDCRIDLERWLARLRPEDRFVLILLDGEGWSSAEIAERLGWSRSKVKVRAHRARKLLRALVEEESQR